MSSWLLSTATPFGLMDLPGLRYTFPRLKASGLFKLPLSLLATDNQLAGVARASTERHAHQWHALPVMLASSWCLPEKPSTTQMLGRGKAASLPSCYLAAKHLRPRATRKPPLLLVRCHGNSRRTISMAVTYLPNVTPKYQNDRFSSDTPHQHIQEVNQLHITKGRPRIYCLPSGNPIKPRSRMVLL